MEESQHWRSTSLPDRPTGKDQSHFCTQQHLVLRFHTTCRWLHHHNDLLQLKQTVEAKARKNCTRLTTCPSMSSSLNNTVASVRSIYLALVSLSSAHLWRWQHRIPFHKPSDSGKRCNEANRLVLYLHTTNLHLWAASEFQRYILVSLFQALRAVYQPPASQLQQFDLVLTQGRSLGCFGPQESLRVLKTTKPRRVRSSAVWRDCPRSFSNRFGCYPTIWTLSACLGRYIARSTARQ